MPFVFFQQLFTGIDNKTADIGRVIWFCSIVAFIGMACYAAYTGKYIFDPVTFGGGLSSLLAAGGAALRMKSPTEPEGCDH